MFSNCITPVIDSGGKAFIGLDPRNGVRPHVYNCSRPLTCINDATLYK